MPDHPTITTFYGDGRPPETREMTDEELIIFPVTAPTQQEQPPE